MANTLAIALTEAGVASARKEHPENTKRKAVSIKVASTKKATFVVESLGGVELTSQQVYAQFHAHWTLIRKQAGSKKDPNYTGYGPYDNPYSRKIIAETHAILHSNGIRKTVK